MAETNLIDELHLTVRVPDDLPQEKLAAIRRSLAGDEFQERLRQALLDVFRAFPELTPCRVSLAR